MFRCNDQVDIVSRFEAMVNGAEKGVGIRWKVYSSGGRLEVQHSTNERWILMREAIVFLTSPSTSFDVIDTSKGRAPIRFLGLTSEVRKGFQSVIKSDLPLSQISRTVPSSYE